MVVTWPTTVLKKQSGSTSLSKTGRPFILYRDLEKHYTISCKNSHWLKASVHFQRRREFLSSLGRYKNPVELIKMPLCSACTSGFRIFTADLCRHRKANNRKKEALCLIANTWNWASNNDQTIQYILYSKRFWISLKNKKDYIPTNRKQYCIIDKYFTSAQFICNSTGQQQKQQLRSLWNRKLLSSVSGFFFYHVINNVEYHYCTMHSRSSALLQCNDILLLSQKCWKNKSFANGQTLHRPCLLTKDFAIVCGHLVSKRTPNISHTKTAHSSCLRHSLSIEWMLPVLTNTSPSSQVNVAAYAVNSTAVIRATWQSSRTTESNSLSEEKDEETDIARSLMCCTHFPRKSMKKCKHAVPA